MLLRLVVWIAVVVLSGDLAWAEGGNLPTPSPDQYVEMIKAGGPWGLVGLCFTVITILWFRISARDDEIRDLNKDLITAVRQAEATSANVTNALQSLEKANRAASEVAGERWDAVKGMSVDIVKVALLVEGNKSSIAELKAVLEGLRNDIQQLWRRPQP